MDIRYDDSIGTQSTSGQANVGCYAYVSLNSVTEAKNH
jgi:hypothetical protein